MVNGGHRDKRTGNISGLYQFREWATDILVYNTSNFGGHYSPHRKGTPVDPFYLVIIFYLLFLMYAANQADMNGTPGKAITRALMHGVIALMVLFAPFTLLLMNLSAQPDAGLPSIDPGSGILIVVLATICSVIAYSAIHSEDFQTWLGTRFKGYKPDSLVHQSAVILCLLVIVNVLFNFVLSGGLAALAETFEETGISPTIVIFDGAIWVIVALLGVGYAIRRTWAETLERLGLSVPNREQVFIGIGTGIAAVFIAGVFQAIWFTISPENLEQQTVATQAINNAVTSLPLAILIAASAAIGEELFMRGALQPIFGAWAVSGLFTILHSQYLFTPIMIFIFGLAMVLSWLRFRYGTATAIIAHFVYNVLPFVILFAAQGAV